MTKAPETKGYLKITVNKPCQWPQEDCICECSYCGHRPEPEIKECSCGLKKKIEIRIKQLDDDNNRLKNSNFSSFMNNNDIRISELKDLLK